MQASNPCSTIAPSSRASLFFNPFLNFSVCNQNPIISLKSPVFSSLAAIPHGLQARASIVYARKKKRRTRSQRSTTKLVLELASLLASNLKILPPPLDLVIAELSAGDGNGGGAGLWRGFGGGGSDEWRRKRKIPQLLIGFLIVCGLIFLVLTDFEIDAVCGVLGFALFSVTLIQLWQKRGIAKIFVWGFCIFGSLIALGLRRSEVQKWVGKLGVYNPKMKILRRKIRSMKIF